MKTIASIVLLLGLLTNGASGSDVYAPEINAMRERQRQYIEEMNRQVLLIDEFTVSWKLINTEIDYLKNTVESQVSAEVPTSLVNNEATRLLARIANVLAWSQRAKSQAIVAESELNKQGAIAESALASTEVAIYSPLFGSHQNIKTEIATTIQALQQSLTEQQQMAQQYLERWTQLQRESFARVQLDQQMKIKMDLEFMLTLDTLATTFDRLRWSFYDRLKVGDTVKSKELLDAYAWFWAKIPLNIAVKVDSPPKQQDFLLLMKNLDHHFTEMSKQLAVKTPQKAARTWKSAVESFEENSSVKTPEDFGVSPTDNADNSCRLADIDTPDGVYEGKNHPYKELIEAARKDPDRAHGYIELPNGTVIAIAAAEFTDKAVQTEVKKHIAKHIAELPVDTIGPAPAENHGPRYELPKTEIDRIRDAVCGAKERTPNRHVKAELDELKAELDRLAVIQEFYDGALKKAVPAAMAELPRARDKSRQIRGYGEQDIGPPIDRNSPDPADLGKIRDLIIFLIARKEPRVAMAITLANFAHSLACDQTLFGKNVSDEDKAFMAAEIIGSLLLFKKDSNPLQRFIRIEANHQRLGGKIKVHNPFKRHSNALPDDVAAFFKQKSYLERKTLEPMTVYTFQKEGSKALDNWFFFEQPEPVSGRTWKAVTIPVGVTVYEGLDEQSQTPRGRGLRLL